LGAINKKAKKNTYEGTTEAMAAGILAKVIGTLGDTTTTATITGRIMTDLRVVLMMVLKF
jgi:hypothetical protein